MEASGLVLNGVGAILVAIGQYDVSRSVELWPSALQVSVETTARGEGPVVIGADEHVRRSLRRTKWLSPIGWLLFVVGIVLQLISHL
jgi:hypothetical protein